MNTFVIKIETSIQFSQLTELFPQYHGNHSMEWAKISGSFERNTWKYKELNPYFFNQQKDKTRSMKEEMDGELFFSATVGIFLFIDNMITFCPLVPWIGV